jgi:hypothetical protein
LLTQHPLGGGFLAMPGLEELLGEALEGVDVDSRVDGTTHPLHFEFLTEREGEGFGHWQ